MPARFSRSSSRRPFNGQEALDSLDDSGADFLRLADMALLAAKDEARNCVRQAENAIDCPPGSFAS